MSAHAGDQHLVTMANQIAAFFATQRRGEPAMAVADHLRSFWTPAMRARLITLKLEGAAGLAPLAAEAAHLLVGDAPPPAAARGPGHDTA